MTPSAMLQRQRPDLATVEGIHEFFNTAESFNDECRRYATIMEFHGGVRPAMLDERPLRSNFFSRDYPGPGPAGGD